MQKKSELNVNLESEKFCQYIQYQEIYIIQLGYYADDGLYRVHCGLCIAQTANVMYVHIPCILHIVHLGVPVYIDYIINIINTGS